MLRNFYQMPRLLKLLTASTLALIVFLVGSVLPHGSISAFGRQMSTTEWWASGAGAITVLAAVLPIASAALMLKRSRYGRPAYVLGWVVLSLATPVLVAVTKGNAAGAAPSMIFSLVVTVLIALYLYRSKAVRGYFDTAASVRS